MAKPGDRLKEARLRAGFQSVAEAARTLKMHPQNWADHEAHRRQIREKNAREYGRKLKISWVWLLTGQDATKERKVPLVGYVGAGAQVYAYSAQNLDYIDAPAGADDEDLAFEVRGASMPPFRDGGIVLVKPVENVADVLYRLGVVDLEDGRRFFKQIMPGVTPGTYTLISLAVGEPPIADARIVAAAKFHIYVEPN